MAALAATVLLPVLSAASAGADDTPVPPAPTTPAEAPVETPVDPVDTPLDLRLLSSPDFLNADVADLRHGPGYWSPKRSENGSNASYERALDRILDDWVAQAPAGVLVAGDLVNGHWGRDTDLTGNFGPVRTRDEQRAALRRAAATYYPAWLERFRRHGLDVYPSTGDHEYGDNDWSPQKRFLAPKYAQEFARYFTTQGSGAPRFADHPKGPHARTAYAWRPHPNVQVVSIDVFDITRRAAHVRVDKAQLRWLRGVLDQARRDGVTWTVVQGHTPILGPTRYAHSSRLQYEGGRDSKLWKVFKRFGVDVYLCGEVHDVTATTQDGILQLAHGGAFQFGLTNYALLDFRSDRLDVTLNDYRLHMRNGKDRSRLWETTREGMRKVAVLTGGSSTIGTLSLSADGGIAARTGILLPFEGYPSMHRVPYE